MTRRRIAIVAPGGPDEFVGGIERFGRGLALAFARAGCEVVHARAGRDEDRLADGVRWRSIRVEADELDPWRLAKPRLASAILEALHACDEVHVLRFDAGSIDIVPRLAAHARTRLWLHDHGTSCARAFRHDPPAGMSCPRDESARAPVADPCASCLMPWIGTHAAGGIERLRDGLARRRDAAARALSAAHELLAPSHSHADALRAVHGGLALRVVEPGVEECFLATGRDATSAAQREGALRVLHAGNHGWWKGSCDLLDAFEEIDRADATLVLAGTGIDASWTRRLERAARLARLEQHGAYEPAGLARVAAGCDVAVFPSRLAESFGLAAAECGAAGLELVVSDRGDLPERVGGDASLVVPAGDARALARMLERLADAKFSGRLRRGAQRRARDTDACVRELLA